MGLIVLAGCDRKGRGQLASDPHDRASVSNAAVALLPCRITDRFGMTFCLVTIDTARRDHENSFPERSYYFQETEMTYEQFHAFRELTISDWEERVNLTMPGQWRDVSEFADALSAENQNYDYFLPTKAQWSFACMNGYEQTCPGRAARSTAEKPEPRRPNKYGIEGFLNYDAECGAVPGLFMGKLDGVAAAHNGQIDTECQCQQYTMGHPDADDGLDELIVARFILVPKKSSTEISRPSRVGP